MNFYGEFQHTLTNKNQITIPAKFRQALGESFIISKGFHKCLSIYSQAGYEALTEKTEKIVMTDTDGQWFNRMFFSSVFDCVQDGYGRFVIPTILRDYAEFRKDIVSIGVRNRIELWDKDVWTAYCADSESVPLPPFLNEEMRKKLMEIGI